MVDTMGGAVALGPKSRLFRPGRPPISYGAERAGWAQSRTAEVAYWCWPAESVTSAARQSDGNGGLVNHSTLEISRLCPGSLAMLAKAVVNPGNMVVSLGNLVLVEETPLKSLLCAVLHSVCLVRIGLHPPPPQLAETSGRWKPATGRRHGVAK
jgi:hypothetical protein